MRQSVFTARAAVLALVVAALLFTLAYPARQYIAQRQQIASLQQQIRDGKANIADMKQARLSALDPRHIEQEARERLRFVRPGEPSYVLLRAQPRTATLSGPVTTLAKQSTWYGRLWASAQEAGAAAPPAGELEVPAPTASPPAEFVPKRMPRTVSSGPPAVRQGPPSPSSP